MSIKTLSLNFFLFLSFIATAQVWNTPESITPIEVGQTIPDGTLVDSELNSTALYEVLNNQKAVIVIYRGGWCPYCNKQLAELTDIESKIKDLGYRILAISPEDAVNIKESLQKNNINYELYSDAGAQLIQDLGLAFYSNDKTNNYIAKKSSGDHSGILPVPAVIVLGADKKVKYIYHDANYKVRLDSNELLSVLNTMN
jgi:peroxiredoxin